MPMKRISLAAILATAFAAPLPAQADLAAGVAALQEEQYDKALAELKPLATAGDVEAQFRMGQMFENGWSVRASYQEALVWYRRAADRGHVEATIRIGDFHQHGFGIPRSRREAYGWYLKAAEKGHPGAMALVGRWNLEGIAKWPDFLAAKTWLNKAAAAGDAGAQELIDTLASKNHPILDIPGTATPTEEAAQRVLAEMQNLLEPMLQAPSGSTRLKLSQPATVTPAGSGQLVTLPLVELLSNSGTWRLGVVQVLFTPEGDDYAVELRLPSLSRLLAVDGHERGSLRIDGRKITGLWSTALHTLTDYTADLTGIRYQSSEGLPWVMTVKGVTARRTYTPLGDGRYDIAELAESTDLRTEGGIGADRRVMTLAGAAYTVRYGGLDVPALAQVATQFGIDWRTRVLIAGAAPGELPESVPQVVGSIELGLKVSDMVTLDGDGQQVGTLAGAELSVSGSDLDKAQSGMKIHYGHDGMTGSGETALLPSHAEVDLSAHRIPVGAVMAASLGWWRSTAKPQRATPSGALMVSTALPMAGGTLPDVDKIGDALRAANSELRIDKVVLTGQGYNVALSGAVTSGPTAKLEVAVKGLDALIGSEPPPALAPGEEPTPTWNPLELLTRVKAMAVDDRDTKTFHIAIQPDGKVSVNGKDASKVLGQ